MVVNDGTMRKDQWLVTRLQCHESIWGNKMAGLADLDDNGDLGKFFGTKVYFFLSFGGIDSSSWGERRELEVTTSFGR